MLTLHLSIIPDIIQENLQGQELDSSTGFSRGTVLMADKTECELLAKQTFLNNGEGKLDDLITAVTNIRDVRLEAIIDVLQEVYDTFFDATAVEDERVGDDL